MNLVTQLKPPIVNQALTSETYNYYMRSGIPNHGDFTNKAANLGPLSRRAQNQNQDKFSNLFLKENSTQKEDVQDAVFRTVGKIVDQPKLGESPHLVDSFKYSRNNFQARERLKTSEQESGDKVETAWHGQAAKSKAANRKFTSLDNDPIKADAPAAESIQETISRLEQRVASLEEQVIGDRFTSNPKVSFPESVAQSKNLKHGDANYQAHGKSYSSMLSDLGRTTNRIGLA